MRLPNLVFIYILCYFIDFVFPEIQAFVGTVRVEWTQPWESLIFSIMFILSYMFSPTWEKKIWEGKKFIYQSFNISLVMNNMLWDGFIIYTRARTPRCTALPYQLRHARHVLERAWALFYFISFFFSFWLSLSNYLDMTIFKSQDPNVGCNNSPITANLEIMFLQLGGFESYK